MLEIACERPETAMGVARHAERVIQSCVGLSLTRRARAIDFVSAKQRDSTADPRIRIAACRLAIELGSADLPAWAESWRYLSDPKNRSNTSLVGLADFVEFASNPGDLRTVASLSLEPVITALETSTDSDLLTNVGNALPELVPRLNRGQLRRAQAALFAKLSAESVPYALGGRRIEVGRPRIRSGRSKTSR